MMIWLIMYDTVETNAHVRAHTHTDFYSNNVKLLYNHFLVHFEKCTYTFLMVSTIQYFFILCSESVIVCKHWFVFNKPLIVHHG